MSPKTNPMSATGAPAKGLKRWRSAKPSPSSENQKTSPRASATSTESAAAATSTDFAAPMPGAVSASGSPTSSRVLPPRPRLTRTRTDCTDAFSPAPRRVTNSRESPSASHHSARTAPSPPVSTGLPALGAASVRREPSSPKATLYPISNGNTLPSASA